MCGNVDYTIKKDYYGRRIMPQLPEEDVIPTWNSTLVPTQNLRTNSRLLAIIQAGGEIPPTSDPKTYADPGHALEGVTDDERYQSALELPLHNYRASPTSRFAVSRDDVRRVVSSAIDEATRIRAERSTKSVAAAAAAGSEDA